MEWPSRSLRPPPRLGRVWGSPGSGLLFGGGGETPIISPEMLVRKKIRYLLQLVPGKQHFGMYRFLPFFFLLGGAMEWFMINVRLGEETFYDVYRRKRSERQYERRMEER
ncbi:small integral membrane protein 4 isoform X3 [Dermochelys coriacea]|uniref:small integral membrane protein 4 isoform X3 n=1 Tax=Dermochelys coriacea TaxID=27794 RepID=UPI0018E8D564|nr:small integral membrane protein 4 isoform X3 [Dermochelys coriacea]